MTRLIVTSAGVLAFANALAHGEDWELRMAGKRVGAYDLTVRTSPKQPRAGKLHVEAQLIDPQTLAYVDHARVSALARRVEGVTDQTGPVSSRYRRPWHEMNLVLDKSGTWDVQLVVDDPRTRGHASFRIEVLPEDKK